MSFRKVIPAFTRALCKRNSSTESKSLFTPFTVGAIKASNRVVMAPMTRGRSEKDGTPNADLMAEYYMQRAECGIVITEATGISRVGLGWQNAPGLWNDKHQEQWAKVTKGVHAVGGKIVLQLWQMGRAVHPDNVGGLQPVAPSAVAANAMAYTAKGQVPCVTPRELTKEGIAEVVHQYAETTRRAKEAGFDGVELHGANGYLIDEFMRDGANKRTDEYGGSIDNRLRFMLESIDACVKAWEAGRVGIRFSPGGTYNDMKDSDPVALFTRAAEELNKRKIAFIHVIEPIGGMMYVPNAPEVAKHIRKKFQGALIINGGLDKKTAAEYIAQDKCDAIAIGEPSLANPDLVHRWAIDAPLNKPNRDTYYSPGHTGYTDYPFLDDEYGRKKQEQIKAFFAAKKT